MSANPSRDPPSYQDAIRDSCTNELRSQANIAYPPMLPLNYNAPGNSSGMEIYPDEIVGIQGGNTAYFPSYGPSLIPQNGIEPKPIREISEEERLRQEREDCCLYVALGVFCWPCYLLNVFCPCLPCIL